ncbi:MAG: hypothetical protein BMS9Abin01_1910 [Gammaproteobacteria bacterium]|nr:MAG: hypothetical protein BMS9Abin01_1910 [Gammaproteobacteria bacterium]
MTSDDWSPGEPLMAGLNRTRGGMGRVLDELQATVRNIAAMSEAISAQSQAIPKVSTRVASVLD